MSEEELKLVKSYAEDFLRASSDVERIDKLINKYFNEKDMLTFYGSIDRGLIEGLELHAGVAIQFVMGYSPNMPSLITYINDVVSKYPQLYELLKINVLMSFILGMYLGRRWVLGRVCSIDGNLKGRELVDRCINILTSYLAAFEQSLAILSSIEARYGKELEKLDELSKWKLVFAKGYIKLHCTTLRRVLEYVEKRYGIEVRWPKGGYHELIYGSETLKELRNISP